MILTSSSSVFFNSDACDIQLAVYVVLFPSQIKQNKKKVGSFWFEIFFVSMNRFIFLKKYIFGIKNKISFTLFFFRSTMFFRS
jgi:hypothetical protein